MVTAPPEPVYPVMVIAPLFVIGRAIEFELGVPDGGQRQQQQHRQPFERRFHTTFSFPGERLIGSFSMSGSLLYW
jgi:hypothetical protein